MRKFNQYFDLDPLIINRQLQLELVDHLYKGYPVGIYIGVIFSVVIFLNFYNHTPLYYLLPWYFIFNIMLFFMYVLNYSYKRFKTEFDIKKWNYAYSISLIIGASLWGVAAFIPSDEVERRYVLWGVLFLIAAGYTQGTVGFFILSVICVNFILAPLAIISFLENSINYHILGAAIVLFIAFLLGISKKNTEWLKNILKLKIENSYATYQANHDILTDLPNQRFLIQLLEEELQNSRKIKQSFAIICFSINRLDLFNSSLGYQAGDIILQTLARRLDVALAEAENVDARVERTLTHPRFDVFGIILKPLEFTNLQDEINHLFTVIENPLKLEQREAKLSASVGVSIYPQDGDSPGRLLSNAYAAMFQGKQRGGNQVEYYKNDINEKTPWLLQLEADLNRAVKNASKELLVYYQPIIDLSTSRVASMEALLRWKHPKLGLLMPNDFISLGEETGLIMPIGNWVLEQAMIQTKYWQQKNLSHTSLKVSVNLSPRQLHQAGLLDFIDHTLSKTGLSPESLDLELTETAILDTAVSDTVHALTKRKISISIDDFGTGYSGLSYLKTYDINRIKIDKSFIQDLTTDAESVTIVSAILNMAHELGVKTLAEGVENKEQLEFLKERGCRYIQGYYFSKPLTANEFTQYIQDDKKL